MEHGYFEVDVFAAEPFSGNPLAVVADAGDLSTEQMQRIANWTNFSETAFILPATKPQADYRLRIFTPFEELLFAGHPTLGTARTWRELGNEPQVRGEIIQECGLGLVTVREEAIRNADEEKQTIFSFATPPQRRSGPLSDDELAAACRSLNIDAFAVIEHAWADNGPGWCILQLRDADAVRSVHPASDRIPRVGIVGLEDDPAPGEALYEVRAFTAEFEDPVTGSFNGCVAQFLRERELVPHSYTCQQGSQLGRAGIIHVFDDGQEIWIGGSVDIRVTGTLNSHRPNRDLGEGNP